MDAVSTDTTATILDRVVLPVVGPKNARRSAKSLSEYDPGEVVLVHVVEKSGGGVDSAPVQQREKAAQEAFDAGRSVLTGPTVTTELRYGSDIPEMIFETAVDVEADSIAFVPRSGNRLVRFLTGDIAHSLITKTDRPVVALPDPESQEA